MSEQRCNCFPAPLAGAIGFALGALAMGWLATWATDGIRQTAKIEAVAHGAARWTVSAEGEIGFEWIAPKEQP